MAAVDQVLRLSEKTTEFAEVALGGGNKLFIGMPCHVHKTEQCHWLAEGISSRDPRYRHSSSIPEHVELWELLNIQSCITHTLLNG